MLSIDEIAERAARDLRADVRGVTKVEAGLASIQGAVSNRAPAHRWSRWIVAASMVAAVGALLVVVIPRNDQKQQIVPADVPTTEATTSVETTPATTPTPVSASCDPAALLVAVEAAIPVSWTSVNVNACRGGFATLVAIADQSACPAGTECRENQLVWMQDVAGEWVYLTSGTEIGCEPDQISPVIEEACAYFATLSTAPTTSLAVEATSLDGPVMRYPVPSNDEVGMAAEIRGVLQLEGQCLYVADTTGSGQRYPILWPAGTTWDVENQSVITPGGKPIPVGVRVLGAGGYLGVSNIERLTDSAASDLARRCVANTYDEIAVVNNQPDAIARGI